MEIKILVACPNVVHGNSVLHFNVGDVKNLPEDLANKLVKEGKAEPVAKASRKTHSEHKERVNS